LDPLVMSPKILLPGSLWVLIKGTFPFGEQGSTGDLTQSCAY
jgi:hypothetical protein